MPLFESHRVLKLAASLVAVAWIAAPGPGFSQVETELVANDEAQQQIFDAIAAAQSRGGPRSVELADSYATLAIRYIEAKDYDLALVAINDALYVVRTNFGLYSLEQAPLLRLSHRLEVMRHNGSAALVIDQELLTLVRHNPNDVDTVPILREIADRYRGEEGLKLRSEAIGVLQRNEPASDQLVALETELVRQSYYSLGGFPAKNLPHGYAYEAGRDSLRRVASYQDASAGALLARVEALVALADWEQLFKEKESALETYEEAYALLEQNGVEQSAIDRLFAPTIPVALPAFRPSPLSSEPTDDSVGYIEVAFEINKYGFASGVQVLDTSTISNKDIERSFMRWVRNNRFRPRVVGDEFARNAPVVARYYVGSAPSLGVTDFLTR